MTQWVVVSFDAIALVLPSQSLDNEVSRALQFHFEDLRQVVLSQQQQP